MLNVPQKTATLSKSLTHWMAGAATQVQGRKAYGTAVTASGEPSEALLSIILPAFSRARLQPGSDAGAAKPFSETDRRVAFCASPCNSLRKEVTQ